MITTMLFVIAEIKCMGSFFFVKDDGIFDENYSLWRNKNNNERKTEKERRSFKE